MGLTLGGRRLQEPLKSQSPSPRPSSAPNPSFSACLQGDVIYSKGFSFSLNKITRLGWQILTQAVTLLCISAAPNVGGLSRQTRTGTGSYCGVWAPVCFAQLRPAAPGGSRVANDLVMEPFAADKAKGSNRIQVPFTFPLEEFTLIAF